MSLSNLSLFELRDLATTLTTLDDIGAQLWAANLHPVFDLTPGQAIRITTSYTVPPMADEEVRLTPLAAKIVSEAVAPPDLIDQLVDAFTPSIEAAPGYDGEEALNPPAPVEAPPFDPPVPVGGAPISSVEVSSAAEPVVKEAEDGDGGQLLAAAPPPVTTSSESEGTVAASNFGGDAERPVPGSASALAAKAMVWGGEWTEAQDSQLVTEMVSARLSGKPKAHVFAALAVEFGRTAKAVELRSYKLRARIDATVAESEATPSPAAAVGAPGQGDAAVGGQSLAAVQGTDDLTAHLAGMTDKGGWSLQRDTDLMELSIASWPAGDIALEIGMQVSAIKPRFDALTGLHDDEATGKKVRRWTREQVLDGLKSLAQLRAA